jgi:hypothetical protein
MALIFSGKSKCAVCAGILREGEELVATSHFITESSDPLYRYSDAGMHLRCFVGWPLRHDFIRRFNEGMRELVPGRYMSWDGAILDGTPEEAADSFNVSLWVILDEERLRAPDGERYRRAWEELTRPEQLGALERRAKQDLNPYAREMTEKALEECRRRGSGETTAQG